MSDEQTTPQPGDPFAQLAATQDALLARLELMTQQTHDGGRLLGDFVKPFNLNNNGRIFTGVQNTFTGFNATELTGATGATLTFYDAGNANDEEPFLTVTLDPDESTRDCFTARGLSIVKGLYIAVAGAVRGAVYLGSA